MDWIAQHYYGHKADHPFHSGKLTEKDFEFMKDFMLAQPYITKFEILDPSSTEITHNLDRFRPLFVTHPANYPTTYCMAFGITDPAIHSEICKGPWLHVPKPTIVPNRSIVVNRSLRGFAPPGLNEMWTKWKVEDNLDKRSIFVGLPDEYDAFVKLTGWTKIEYHPTKTMLELAQLIAGAERFLGNQSVALSIAQGLRTPYYYETRRDLPIERNESYFVEHDSDSGYF